MKIDHLFRIATAAFLLTVASRAEAETFGDIATRLGVPFMGYLVVWKPNGDVNGQVGYPLRIAGPGREYGPDVARCSSGWSAQISVSSGELPPGMTFNQNDGSIAGIPTQRGHWIVTMQIQNMMCNGHRYEGSGMPDVVSNYLQSEGTTSGDPEQCGEGSMGYCNQTAVRFHITGTGEVVQ